MPYKYEDVLRKKAMSFIDELLQAGIEVDAYPAMFRDYVVKIVVQDQGYINIHYSPKKDSFSLTLHEIRDKRLHPKIEACWQGKPIDTPTTPEHESDAYQAYVDGSYIDDCVGYGAVIIKQGEEIARLSGYLTQYTEQRQVVGELQATMEVLRWCQQNNVAEIEIFYDYKGIEKWATGAWRANNEATQGYARFVKASTVKVHWHKVKSHTGNYWNDIADELAKQGAQSQGKTSTPTKSDAMAIAEQKALAFIAYLAEHDIHAEFVNIYNGQFARVNIEGGYFDLYNTKNRPLSPYLHNFKNSTAVKSQIDKHWQRFQAEERFESEDQQEE